MTGETVNNMVLRTVYLPLETDRQLKALAFTRDVSKGELIRELINQGLAAMRAAGERSLAEKVSARAKEHAASAGQQPEAARRAEPAQRTGKKDLRPKPVQSPARAA